ncbi:MBG domain-containing protein [Methyloraptor flagellatus]|uniref:MBG domain-containing protein n=1 Tax=Methyloraptor flagellatus TaxID=3162530 RepID=A0AAU7XDB3_9HYPH
MRSWSATALSDGKFVVKVGGADTEAKTSGVIKAAEAELKANGGNVYALAGNTASLTKATGVANRGGRIFLTAGDGGTVTVAQKVSARATAAGGKARGGDIRVSGGTVKVSGKISARGKGDAGGTVVVTGREVSLASTARIDARGTSGGTVLVGGDYRGGYDPTSKFLAETVATATNTVVDAGARILVDGTAGAGGRAVVWSDRTTIFAGNISATATGTAAGGTVETSGHNLVLGDTVSISTLSAQGKTGLWLIDPYDVTISSSGSSNVQVDVSGDPWRVAPTASGANINNTTLASYLASSNVAITTNGAGTEAGNITVSAAVSWSAATTLSLLADASTGGVFVNANLTGSNAASGLILSAGSGGINQAGGTAIRAGTLTVTAANGGSVALTNTGNLIGTLGASSAAGSFAFTNGQSLTVSGAITSNGTLSLTTSSGDLTISGALADAHSGSSLTLSAAGDLKIGKDVTRSGANAAVSLAFGGSYSLIDGARVSLPDSGATLSIGGASYTLVHDLTGLQAMSTAGRYALGNDIDASATAGWNSGAGFVPIGDSSTAFTGTFTGLGHFIDGLTINRPSTSIIGLFGYANAATLRDVTLSNVSITGAARVGGLAGWSDTSALTNIHVTGAISATQETGGITGWLVDTTLSKSSSSASVTATANGAGGLAGRILYSGTISDSYATGAVTAAADAGGLVGEVFSATPLTLSNVYASGQVTGASASSGGLIGADDAASPSSITFTNAYWDANATGRSSAGGNTAGSTITGTAVDVSAAPRTQSTYSGFDFTNTWVMIAGETRPMLRNEYSTVIATPAALQLMSQNLAGSYKLGANVDLTSALAVGSGGYYSGLWGASGFVPVGDTSTKFTGSFDGQNHTITGLTITRGATNYVGLFGFTNGATIANVTLLGGSITGNDGVGPLIGYMLGGSVSAASASATVSGVSAGEVNSGGLIGTVDGGSVSSSSASGNVTGAGYQVGGLVGFLVNAGSVTQSYATGNVTGTNTSAGNGYIGGLVGANGYSGNGGTISRSYATGIVTGASGPVGGFVGHNEGTITDSYATGPAIGTGTASNIGGFVGVNFVNGTITNAYSTGYVTGPAQLGGFAGYNNNNAAALTNVYWDTQTSGQSGGMAGGSGSVTARTTAQLQGSLPAGFSSSIWGTGANLYPYFGWRYSTTPIAVSGVAYSDAGSTVLSAKAVTAVSGGVAIGSAVTGDNGYYYILADASKLAVTGALAYLDNGSTKGAAFSDVAGTNGIQNVAIYGTAAHLITGQSTLTATRTNYLAARGAYADTDLSFLSSSTFAPLTTTAGYGVYLNTTGNYTLNANIGSSGALSLDSGGTFTVSASLTASAAGLLSIADAVSLSGVSVLTLSTTNSGDMSLGGAVTSSGGTLIVSAAGTATTSSTINVGTFRLAGGTWRQIAASLPTFTPTDFSISAGATFLRVLGGDGSVATPYRIADVYGLQGIGSTGLTSQRFVLANDIDATATGAWTTNNGFVPIGNTTTAFTGSLDGAGHTISNLAVGQPTIAAGLFGVIGAAGTVHDLTISGSVRGLHAGVLAGTNAGTITNVVTSGSARNSGAAGAGGVGGLVGTNTGSITGSSSTATALTVIANTTVGGLVGSNAGTITTSYAQGAVTAGAAGVSAGGLVGRTTAGTIGRSFATGAITAASDTDAGGLVGSNAAAISDTYATGAISGGANGGGLVGVNTGTIASSYATGALPSSGGTYGGLVGSNSGTVTASAWNTTTSATTLGVGTGTATGVTGRTTTEMTSLSFFSGAGWSIDDTGGTASTWRIYDGFTAPLLRNFMTGLTVTGGAGSKNYDGSATSTSVGTLTYNPPGYTTALVSGTAIYTASSADAGTYSGAGLRLSGFYSSQFGYDITFTPGTLTVAKVGLAVAVGAATKTYDGLAYAGGAGVSYTGFVGSDTAASLGGTLVYGGAAQGAVNAGSYTLTASGLTSNNYTITYTPSTLTIGRAGLTVLVNGASKTYDGTAYTGGNGVSYAGFVGSDTTASLGGTLVYGGAAQGAINAGSYALTASGLTSNNYDITYTPATLTIGRAGLSVLVGAASKTYDGAAYTGGNGVSYAGFVGSDTASSLGGTLVYGGAAQGAINAGSYALTASGLTSGNYDITYTPATLTIGRAALTVGADGNTMVYGDAVPTLTYTVSTGRLYGSDTLTGALATGATSTAAVGDYAIGQGTLAASSNYTLSFVGGTLRVTPRPITVTADDKTRVVGTNNPALTYRIGGRGLAAGDVLSGALSTAADSSSPAGRYAILQGSLGASANYVLTYVPGTLTVVDVATPPPPPAPTGPIVPTFVETDVPDQIVTTIDTRDLIAFLGLPGRVPSPGSNPAGSNPPSAGQPGPSATASPSTARAGSCDGTSSSGRCAFLPVQDNLPVGRWLSFRSP